jgi:Uma2 family endonuclease
MVGSSCSTYHASLPKRERFYPVGEVVVSTIARLSLAEYDRMIACGLFDGKNRRRIELIHGELREMNLIGPTHEEVVDRLNRWSIKHLPEDRVRVRVQNSIGLPALQSAPEPDIAWVVERDYSRGRPTAADVLLGIEVAESSLKNDIGEKADLYAAAGIADY